MCACSREKSAKQKRHKKKGELQNQSFFTAGCNFVKMTWFALQGEL